MTNNKYRPKGFVIKDVVVEKRIINVLLTLTCTVDGSVHTINGVLEPGMTSISLQCPICKMNIDQRLTKNQVIGRLIGLPLTTSINDHKLVTIISETKI